jgi:hypothetical protein
MIVRPVLIPQWHCYAPETDSTSTLIDHHSIRETVGGTMVFFLHCILHRWLVGGGGGRWPAWSSWDGVHA